MLTRIVLPEAELGLYPDFCTGVLVCCDRAISSWDQLLSGKIDVVPTVPTRRGGTHRVLFFEVDHVSLE